MKHRFFISLIIPLLLCFLGPSDAGAQTTITFRIDMGPSIEDSTFFPERSRIELTGNQLPFTKTRNIELEDRPPTDSIYVATLHFPSLTNDKVLKYNYIIIKENKKIKTENRPRLLQLDRQKNVLPITLFNRMSQ